MYDFKIEDMTCGHCMSLVTKAVKSVDPDAKVDIELGEQRVCVTSESDIDEIRTALAEAGYPARLYSAVN